MTREEARRVMDQVQAGHRWQFERTVSDTQARTARSFLTGLGFQVHCEPASTFLHRAPPPGTESAPENRELSEEILETQEQDYFKAQPILMFQFRGNAWDLMAMYLRHWMLTALTLGAFWIPARCEVHGYLWNHTLLGGDYFSYRGRFRDRVAPALLVFAVLVLIGLGWVRVHQLAPRMMPWFQASVGIFAIAAWPVWRVHSRRYHWSRTEWRGLRFGFEGKSAQAVLLYLKGISLLVLTLGLYLPVFVMETAAFWRSRTTLGGRPFRFSGHWRDLAREYTLAWLATGLTLGAALPGWLWIAGRTRRYLWRHTHFDSGTFHYAAAPLSELAHRAGWAAMLVLSLGLAFPWVQERRADWLTRHLTFEGLPDWDRRIRSWRTADSRQGVRRPLQSSASGA